MKERPTHNSIDNQPVIITMGKYKELIRCQVENEYFREGLEKYKAEAERLKEVLKMFLVACN